MSGVGVGRKRCSKHVEDHKPNALRLGRGQGGTTDQEHHGLIIKSFVYASTAMLLTECYTIFGQILGENKCDLEGNYARGWVRFSSWPNPMINFPLDYVIVK